MSQQAHPEYYRSVPPADFRHANPAHHDLGDDVEYCFFVADFSSVNNTHILYRHHCIPAMRGHGSDPFSKPGFINAFADTFHLADRCITRIERIREKCLPYRARRIITAECSHFGADADQRFMVFYQQFAGTGLLDFTVLDFCRLLLRKYDNRIIFHSITYPCINSI